MSLKDIFISGIIPAFLLGIGTVLMKLSLRNGISIPFFITIIGFTVFVCGMIVLYFSKDYAVSLTSTSYATLMGITWSISILCMSYGISKLNVPISIIAPITNSNIIVAVFFGAIIFSEFKSLEINKILIGTFLITIGVIVISSTKIN